MPETPETGSVYLLTDAERTVMQALHTAVLQAEAKAWQAHLGLTAAQHEFKGWLGALATSRGVGGGELTQDFAAIIKPKNGGTA